MKYLPLNYEELEGIDFDPSGLRIQHYTLPDTFGDVGAEDFMARLISFSIGAEKWVGIGLDYFLGQMTEIFLSLIRQKKEKQKNEKMKNDYERSVNSCWSKFLSRFGYKVPEPNYFEESSFINTVLYSRDDFKKAFHYLLDHGYLSVVKHEDGFYLCPTVDAVRKLKKFYASPLVRVYSRLQILELKKCSKEKEILQLIEENKCS